MCRIASCSRMLGLLMILALLSVAAVRTPVLTGRALAPSAAVVASPSPSAKSSTPRPAPGCSLSPALPRPVVVLHGARATSASVAPLVRALRARGACVTAPTYGMRASEQPQVGGMRGVEESATEVAMHIDAVLQRTGADGVVVVAHGAAGIVAHSLLARRGEHAHIRHLITLGTPRWGWVHHAPTTESEAWAASHLGHLDVELQSGSAVMRALRSQLVVQPGVEYVAIASRVDQTAPPSTGTLWKGVPGVRSVSVQDVCPLSRPSHAELVTGWPAISLVVGAVDRRVVRSSLPACTSATGWGDLATAG